MFSSLILTTKRKKNLRTSAKRKILDYIILNNVTPHCGYCGIELIPKVTLTTDHIIPLAKGGTNHFDNLTPCCNECNSKKRNKIWTLKFNRYVPKKESKND